MLQNLNNPLQNKGCVLDIRKDGKFSLLQLSGKRKFREGEDEEEDTRADYKLSEFDEKPTSGTVEKTQKMKFRPRQSKKQKDVMINKIIAMPSNSNQVIKNRYSVQKER